MANKIARSPFMTRRTSSTFVESPHSRRCDCVAVSLSGVQPVEQIIKRIHIEASQIEIDLVECANEVLSEGVGG